MRHLSCCLSLLTQASGIQNPFLFSVSNDHHCNEAYDWWPIADLWSIKCVLSAPGWPHHPSYWHLTLQSPRACSTHYSSTLQAGVTAAANGHTRAVKILSAPTTWDVVKTELVTCLKTKFKWWNFSTFVFIEKVLANDHIIYITFGSETSSHLNYGENFNHTICLSVVEYVFSRYNFISIQPITINLKLWLINLILVLQKSIPTWMDIQYLVS